MIVLAIIATIAALAFSFVVFMANAMSDVSPGYGHFEGAYLLGGAWVVALAYWLAWYVG